MKKLAEYPFVNIFHISNIRAVNFNTEVLQNSGKLINKSPIKKFLKRAFDIVFSALVIVFVLSWVSLIIFVLNLFFSRGPLFFIQDRIGKDNKIFPCIKFRSMHAHLSKNHSDYVATTIDDNRISKLGKYLRKFNIDELPQFINVFLGQMSVVGPRPHALAWNDKYLQYVNNINLRHLIKPGVTGLSQINGLRGDVADEDENRRRVTKRFELDLWYIENWSFWLDIQIIILTAWITLKGDRHAC